MRMVGPANWLVCEFDLSWRARLAGETFLVDGGENLGAPASGDKTGASEAVESGLLVSGADIV